MPKISFFLRSNNDRAKTFVLYCRITFKNSKVEFSTGEKLLRCEFDCKNQKCLSKTKPKRIFIDSLIESISYKVKMNLLQNESISTAREIVDQILFPKPKEVFYIDSIVEAYINSCSNVRATTIKNHKVKLNHLIDFQKQSQERFTIDTFTLKIADKYHEYLKKVGRTTNNTNATRNITFLKMCLFKMMSKYDYNCFAIQNYSGIKDTKKTTLFLNSQDLQKLKEWIPQSLYLRNVRDLFLFQCFTVLSFSDLSHFEVSSKKGIDLISGTRFKNNKPYVCPLLMEAKEILEKHSYKLPLMQNEPYNRGLKEVSAILSFSINLTTHIGRKTFATMMNDKGVSRESVAIMLGHSSLRTSEQHYIGFSSERLFLELDKIG